MFSNNHAKFHAFITKVNNSALFWSLAARLYMLTKVELCSNRNGFTKRFQKFLISGIHCWLFILFDCTGRLTKTNSLDTFENFYVPNMLIPLTGVKPVLNVALTPVSCTT